MTLKLVDIISQKLYSSCYYIIETLEKFSQELCLCDLYQGCLRECSYVCGAVSGHLPKCVCDSRGDQFCVCTFLDGYSLLWLQKVKNKPLWLNELYLSIKKDLLLIQTFGHLELFYVMKNEPTGLVTLERLNFLYFEVQLLLCRINGIDMFYFSLLQFV